MTIKPILGVLWATALSATFAIAGPSTRPAGDGDAAGRPGLPGSDVDQLLDALGGGREPGAEEDPLRFITGDMAGLVTKLAEYQTDKPVQAKQAQVVRSIELVIKELEKQCKGGAAGGGAGGKPLGRSGIVGGPGGQGEMIDPKQGDKQWATLQPKQREQILQSQTEGFPPGYETILQSYYRRLSQEQVSPDGAGAAPQATPPATPAPSPATPVSPTTRPSRP